jgi:hypothetical protein
MKQFNNNLYYRLWVPVKEWIAKVVKKEIMTMTTTSITHTLSFKTRQVPG